MKIIVNEHRCEIDKTPVNELEINITKCEFEFAEEITSEFVKEAYFTLNHEDTYKQIIVNNECNIPSEVLVKKGTIEIGVVAKLVEGATEIKRYNPSPAYFNTWDGSLKEAQNSEPITPSEFDQYEQALQDGLSEVNQKLDDIDQAIEDVNVAITETNNLDLDVSKEGKVATVTLTKKDASTKVVTLSDGTSLMFNWNGTRLGIKTDEDTEYTYVDLQGVQGPIGPKGEAFTIKKTYTSVAEMNADFNNMQLGDYVMIASTVEIEDNAKLYTRGESQWIFISDFSGAQGIKGETGLTPNIQIGTVVSGNNPSVTRTGTNENPILNFTLVKGDKGDTGNTGPTGATGNGIASITKTGTSGLVDTYTITYTDGTTTTFEVTNGEDGEVTETELNVVRTDVDDLRRNQLMNTETGTNINVDDAFDTRIMEDKMSKESTQDGTPTPENPVEVKTVKGYRNLFNKTDNTKIINGFISPNNNIINSSPNRKSLYVNCNPNTNYVITKKSGSIFRVASTTLLPNVNVALTGYIRSSSTDTASVAKITTDENANYLVVTYYYEGEDILTEQEILNSIMIIEGTEELPYVPYGTNWIYTKITNGTDTNYYTIPLNDNEIAGIGDYKDELIVDKNGHCYLNKKIGKVVLDGNTTGITIARAKENSTYFEYLTTIFKYTAVSEIPIGLCNYLEGNTANQLYSTDNQGFTFTSSTGRVRFNLLNTIASTVEELSTWLSTHNLIVYGALETSQLIDLNYNVDIRLFQGNNTITNSDDMDMEIKYVQDINAVINELRNGQAL